MANFYVAQTVYHEHHRCLWGGLHLHPAPPLKISDVWLSLPHFMTSNARSFERTQTTPELCHRREVSVCYRVSTPCHDTHCVIFRAWLESPCVLFSINNAGIKGLSSVINGCLLSFTLSAASSDLWDYFIIGKLWLEKLLSSKNLTVFTQYRYISSRSLYGLSITGNAPRFLSVSNDISFMIFFWFSDCL